MLKKITVLLLVLGLAFGGLVLMGQESRFSIQSVREYSISQERLWRVLAEVERWPDWWPGIESALLVGSFASGNEIHFKFKGISSADPAGLMRVNGPNQFVWERMGVLQSRVGTDFRLESTEQGTLLHVENYIRGPQAILARITGEEAFRKYQAKLFENLGLYLQSKLSAGGEKD